MFTGFKRAHVIALAVAAFAAGGAQADDKTRAMPLGPAVDAPSAYLEFCLREPQDCVSDAAPSATDIAAVRDRAARVFWGGVFGAAQVFEPPAAGPDASDARVADVHADDAPSAADAGRPAVARVAQADLPPLRLDRAQWRRVQRLNQRLNRAIRHREDVAVHGRPDVWRLPADGVGDCEDYALAKRRALIDMGVPASALSLALVRTPRGQSHAVLLLATEKGEMVLDNLNPRLTRWDRAGYVWVMRQEPGRPMLWRSL
ncbi:MAG: transglutaminase-like cysteine peptidase [Brevundimonas sp.]